MPTATSLTTISTINDKQIAKDPHDNKQGERDHPKKKPIHTRAEFIDT